MSSTEYKGQYRKLFPGVLSSNSFLTVYILHLLNKSTKMYGKQIADEIGDRLHGTWEPSHGLVYPILRKMEDMGLIEGVWEGSGDKKTRRFYRIKEEGRKALKNEAINIRPMFEDARQMIDVVMDDLYNKV